MTRLKRHITALLVLPIVAVTLAFTNVENRGFAATSWELDAAHSKVKFSVRHFFTPVEGQFNEWDATVQFSPDNLEESKIDVELPVKSIDTGNEKRDGHLQSKDFFYAEKYPKLSFESNKIRKTAENKFVAEGTMTIRGNSKPFELPFQLLGVQDHPMKENTKVAGITSEFTINRTAYDVGVDDWAATTVIGDEVTVNLLLELHTK